MGKGLKMICKAYGGLRVRQNGRTIDYYWDYKNDCAVSADELKQRAKAAKEAKKIVRPNAVQESLL